MKKLIAIRENVDLKIVKRVTGVVSRRLKIIWPTYKISLYLSFLDWDPRKLIIIILSENNPLALPLHA